MKAFPNTGPKMLFMNLSCIASFLISMTGTMTTSLMMILPLSTLMMGIPLDMIQIEDYLPVGSSPASKAPDSSTAHLCTSRLLFRTVPAPAELTDKATIQNCYS